MRLMTLGEYEDLGNSRSARDRGKRVWVVEVAGDSRQDGIVPVESPELRGWPPVSTPRRSGVALCTKREPAPILIDSGYARVRGLAQSGQAERSRSLLDGERDLGHCLYTSV